MQSNLMTLCKISFLTQSGFNACRYERDRKKRNKTIGISIVLVCVTLMMAGYCFVIGYGLGYMNMAQVIPGYGLSITGIVVLFMTFLKTNGFLFAFKDYDLLMALPINIRAVITSKFMYMYLNNLLFTAIVMIPMGIAYGIWVQPGIIVYLMWLAGILMAPLLPMTIASAVGVVIAVAGSKVKINKILIQVLLSVGLLAGILGGSFWMENSAKVDEAAFLLKIADIGNLLSRQIHSLYPSSLWFDHAITKSSVSSFLLLTGVSVVWYLLFVWFTAKIYRKVNTALLSHDAKANYKMKSLKTNSALIAIAKKEAKRFFSSYNYLMNMGVGLLMALGLAVASLFINLDMVKGISGTVYVVPCLSAMIINMTCTTAVTWSLEGKNLWIVKSLPISKRILFGGKMLFNLCLVLPVSLLCSVFFMISMKPSLILALLYLLFSITSSGLSTVWGMWANIHFPNFEWENEVQVIKQGASSAIGIFSSLLGYMILGGMVFALANVFVGEVVLLVVILLISGVTIGIYKNIIK